MRDLQDKVLGLLAALLVALALAWAGTCDHEEEARHAEWLAGCREAGAAVVL